MDSPLASSLALLLAVALAPSIAAAQDAAPSQTDAAAPVTPPPSAAPESPTPATPASPPPPPPVASSAPATTPGSTPAPVIGSGTTPGATWSGRYVTGSTGLVSQGELLGIPSASALLAGGSNVAGILGLGATVRFVTNHFVLQPQIGLEVLGGPGTFFSGGLVLLGLGVGTAYAVSPTVALTPMARVEFSFDPGGSGGFLLAVAELPITAFVGPNAYLEPYIDLGAFGETGTFGTWLFALGVGYRLGLVF